MFEYSCRTRHGNARYLPREWGRTLDSEYDEGWSKKWTLRTRTRVENGLHRVSCRLRHAWSSRNSHARRSRTGDHQRTILLWNLCGFCLMMRFCIFPGAERLWGKACVHWRNSWGVKHMREVVGRGSGKNVRRLLVRVVLMNDWRRR